MAKYKLVAEFHFEAETMDDALAKLGDRNLGELAREVKR